VEQRAEYTAVKFGFIKVLDEWGCPECGHRFGTLELWCSYGVHYALYKKDGAIDPDEHAAPWCTVCGKRSHWHGYPATAEGQPRRVDRPREDTRHTRME
jgi:hypothetical protein